MTHDRPDRAVDGDNTPTLDDLCRVMRNPHRRVALYFLVEHGRVTVTELEDVVTGWSHAIEGRVAVRDDRTHIADALHVVHLATMESANVASVDRDDGVITLADLPSGYSSFVRWSASMEQSSPPT